MQQARAHVVPPLLTSWCLFLENLHSAGIEVNPAGDGWVKSKRTAIIKKLTANANSAFKARDWMEAARSYTYILQLSRRHDKKFAAVCLSNRCACWLKVRPPRCSTPPLCMLCA